MAIKIRTGGLTLKKFIEDISYVNVESPLTIRELLRKIGVPEEMVAGVIVDGKVVDMSHEVKDGQEVVLMPPMSGG